MDTNRVYSLRHEQVRLLYEAMPLALVATLINAVILFAVEWSVAEHLLSIVWLVSILIITLLRFGLAFLYHRIQPGRDQTHHWEIYFSIGCIVAGAVWGSTSLLLFPESSITHQVFVAFIVGGMCAGAVTSLSALPVPIFSFLILALTPLIVRFFTVGSEITNAMGVMLLLFFIMISANALKSHRNIRQNIELRTESKRQQEIILQSQLEQQVILDNAPVGIWLVGVDGRYRFVNRTFCDAVGVPENEFLATTHLSDLLGEEAAANSLQSDHECLEKEEPHHSHETLTFADGKKHLMDITRAKVRDKAGKVTGIVGIAVDISDTQFRGHRFL
ncbi:MAG: PAS domain-containing protein [Mariprofundaceae bacterium]|nr:PAS domain-containing protein [Mariprofundaceae bacterium]